MSVLALRYTAFAVVATLANLSVQASSLPLYRGSGDLALAMAAGTTVGLVLKYILDRQWIFADRSRGLRAHARSFPLYSVSGILTTAIFWSCELLCAALDSEGLLPLLGGALGLAMGYALKYRLDRRFAFARAA